MTGDIIIFVKRYQKSVTIRCLKRTSKIKQILSKICIPGCIEFSTSHPSGFQFSWITKIGAGRQ